MIVLVDTSVWSLALRRSGGAMSLEATELTRLIRRGKAAIIGPVRQELLSGIRITAQFEHLSQQLRAFPDVQLESDDFELAADCSNRCRARGVQGSNTDFLICAVAARRQHSIFTTDQDFAAFVKVIPVKLHALPSRSQP